MIKYSIRDSETGRELEGEGEFVVMIVDGDPKLVGAAPSFKLWSTLKGLIAAMVAPDGAVRMPRDRRWSALHAAAAQLRLADLDAASPAGAQPPINATDVLRMVGDKLGPDARREVELAVYERCRMG